MKPANRAHAQQINLLSWLTHPLAAHSKRVLPHTLLALLTLSLGFSLNAQAGERLETPVSVNVTESGAATASIQIEVPPGTAGMTPALSLNYVSQGGNGLMGMGWSLGGLSAIYRCGSTMIQDNTPSISVPPNYTMADKYCLDGQRLVAVTGTYGASGTEYRTERETFTKIISYTLTTGSSYFVAQTKSGQIIEFGHTADSAIEVQGKADIKVWAANKISDTVGNYLTITYNEDNANGDYSPKQIDYTGNSTTGTLPYNSVRFAYGARTDITPLYHAGAVTKVMKLLTNIQTYAKVNGIDTVVKDYRVVYVATNSIATGRSLVDTIQECDGIATTATALCLPVTKVGWQGASNPYVDSANFKYGATNFNTVNIQHSNRTVGFQLGDFNGDGKTDILRWWDTVANNALFLSNGDGSFTQATNFAYGTTNFNTVNLQHSNNTVGFQLGDFNGDGKTDILRRWDTVSGNALFLSNGDGSFTQATNFAYGTTNFNTVNLQHSNNTVGFQLGDFNGDGKADILRWADTLANNALFLSNGDGSFTQNVNTNLTYTNLQHSIGKWGFQLGDFNGDGKIDIIRWYDVVSNMALFNALITEQNSVSPDLLTSVTTNLGTSVASVPGTTTLLTYKPLTDPTVYTKDSGTNAAAYPYLDIIAPMYVVSQATVPDGIGGTRSTNYKYFGAKSHLKGGGFLGFRQFDTTDGATLIKTSSVFRQDYPFQGLPLSTVQTQSNGSKLKEVSNTLWGLTTFPDTAIPAPCVLRGGLFGTLVYQMCLANPPSYATTNGSKHQFSYVKQSVEKTYELTNGTTPVTTVQTDNVYDDYGNATTVNVSTPDGYSKTTTNTYWNNPTNWLLGRLTKATVASSSVHTNSAPPSGSPPALYLAANSADLAESNSGITPFTFLVYRNGNTTLASSVSWGVTGSGSNPANAVDFVGGVLPSGVLNFAPGQEYLSIYINVQGDTTSELDENFTVTLSSPTGAALVDTTAVGTIRNDDPAIFIFTPTLANTQNYDLRAAAIASGWDQLKPLNARVTVPNGVVISASTTANYALSITGSYPLGSSIILQIDGGAYIVGKGGAGGDGGPGVGNASILTAAMYGKPGGPALNISALNATVTIINGGVIGGGGGGGGGGAEVNNPGSVWNGGGGGGGGAGSGAGGQVWGAYWLGLHVYPGTNLNLWGYTCGYPGNAGTATAAGAGGAKNPSVTVGMRTGAGGSGGGLGVAGIAGGASDGTPSGIPSYGYGGGPGGAAGAATTGAASATWWVIGTRLGAVQ
jgi:Salmonella virulence plasmid 65kDa B protein/FG-GAP-like repeat/Insecticide toxin TcdB middle/N-terminal region